MMSAIPRSFRRGEGLTTIVEVRTYFARRVVAATKASCRRILGWDEMLRELCPALLERELMVELRSSTGGLVDAIVVK